MTPFAGLLASIPSPSSGTISIGPLKIHAYGLMIALGVVAAVWLLGKRLEQARIGNADDANAIAVWSVIAGVIGSRLYHVATDWSAFEHHLSDIPKIWQGGLGIPGGLAFGIPVGVLMIRRRGMPVGIALNCAAPTLPLAQAIGRWGNYFNQELFGRPTTLPWGLRIDLPQIQELPGKYASLPAGTTFQPTFLYESLLNFILCGLL
ncbi:MAG TPA: prolipoprotein diacylglyceryl transferase, partial [Ilumatobacteraceae bacterium]